MLLALSVTGHAVSCTFEQSLFAPADCSLRCLGCLPDRALRQSYSLQIVVRSLG
jgi:hypothetical protein